MTNQDIRPRSVAGPTEIANLPPRAVLLGKNGVVAQLIKTLDESRSIKSVLSIMGKTYAFDELDGYFYPASVLYVLPTPEEEAARDAESWDAGVVALRYDCKTAQIGRGDISPAYPFISDEDYAKTRARNPHRPAPLLDRRAKV